MRPVGVRCLRCGGATAGSFRGAAWHPHPATGQRWLCHSCYHRTRREADQRLCEQCGAGRPGGASHWCRLPGSANKWLCGRCQAQAIRAHKRRQQDDQGVQTPQPTGESPKGGEPSAKRRLQAGQPPPSPQQEQQLPVDNLLELLVSAAGSPAGAAAGLTAELSASFSALLDRLVPAEQAAKEARLRLLLSLGEHAAAARLMTTALHIGLARLAVGGEE